jgi:hypothetical protein
MRDVDITRYQVKLVEAARLLLYGSCVVTSYLKKLSSAAWTT